MMPNYTVDCPYCGEEKQIKINPGEIIYPRCTKCNKQFEVELPNMILRTITSWD
jgi:transposase-like protein